MSLNVAVLYGSVRKNRQGIKGARFVCRQLEVRGHTVTLIDPLEYALPLLDKRYEDYEPGEAPAVLERLAEIYRAADVIVPVAGEYNHSVTPALKNQLDHFRSIYAWRVAAIASYSRGSFGGVRAAEHLRSILPNLGLITIPTSFAMSQVPSSFDEEGNALDDAYHRRIRRFLDEIAWYGAALREARKVGVPY